MRSAPAGSTGRKRPRARSPASSSRTASAGSRRRGSTPTRSASPAAGYAALVFDYRHLGDSGGEPRQLIDIGRQHDDWRAAIAYARGLDGVDAEPDRRLGNLVRGRPRGRDRRRPSERLARGDRPGAVHGRDRRAPTSAGVADNLRLSGRRACATSSAALLGRAPRPIAVVGPPGTLAAMNSPDAEPGYLALFPPGSRRGRTDSCRGAIARACPATARCARRRGSALRCSSR